MSTTTEQLEKEATALYSTLFGKPISAKIQAEYVRAHNFYLLESKKSDLKELQRMLNLNLDLEAVELILRRKNRFNLLTKKFHILSYIVEVRSSHFTYYINTEDCFLYGLFIALKLGTRTFCKFIKGHYQVWRYNVT